MSKTRPNFWLNDKEEDKAETLETCAEVVRRMNGTKPFYNPEGDLTTERLKIISRFEKKHLSIDIEYHAEGLIALRLFFLNDYVADLGPFTPPQHVNRTTILLTGLGEVLEVCATGHEYIRFKKKDVLIHVSTRELVNVLRSAERERRELLKLELLARQAEAIEALIKKEES